MISGFGLFFSWCYVIDSSASRFLNSYSWVVYISDAAWKRSHEEHTVHSYIPKGNRRIKSESEEKAHILIQFPPDDDDDFLEAILCYDCRLILVYAVEMIEVMISLIFGETKNCMNELNTRRLIFSRSRQWLWLWCPPDDVDYADSGGNNTNGSCCWFDEDDDSNSLEDDSKQAVEEVTVIISVWMWIFWKTWMKETLSLSLPRFSALLSRMKRIALESGSHSLLLVVNVARWCCCRCCWCCWYIQIAQPVLEDDDVGSPVVK